MSGDTAATARALHRLAGEGVPRWVMVAFALVGLLIAAAAAWLWEQAGVGEAPSSPQTQASVAQPEAGVQHAPEPKPDAATMAAAVAPAVPPETAQPDCPAPVRVMFRLDAAQPMGAAPGMGELVDWLGRHPQARLSVEGHADGVGPADYNLVLSYRRAKSVLALLRKAGIEERRMTLLAAGRHAPIEGLPAEAAENRRVVIRVLDCPG